MDSIIIQTPKGERTIGTGHPCFIIAEMSGNHNHDYNKAVEIIHAAAAAGADAVKLQTYTPDTMTIDCDKPAFTVNNEDNPDLWKGKNLHALYQTAYTPWEWQPKLQHVAKEAGIVLFSTPFDPTAVDFLEDMHVPLYKIASYEATDLVLLRAVAKTGKPVIMSVGFATLEEVTWAIQTLRDNGAGEIIVLHCVTGYAGEADLSAMNLRTMLDIGKRFNVTVGFSDNNGGIEVPITAVAMGATVVEKHFMIDRNEGGPDARFSVQPNEFEGMVKGIRKTEKIMGTIRYGCQSPQEEENTFFRRSLFVVENMKKGEVFTEKNMRSIRPSVGMESKYYDDVLGATATQDIERGTPLQWELIQKKV
ncbi:MAG: pseudaminic acid synthase [Candidatus Magasanikbacteria bacterium CG10_big_fil_rev_8_21_14_0_10_43_6]|uniref:Pseudaminic acid synthase n=1 Tax=Candidatus Magasanikbacteria bacterium CG10_big_fil_rev_8_21_14_0_10_43_6 TaxID=1974650 RepID=A0A2M6W192_9BACT|nr:MAG: pseudaminic acid synthase [Candidatus Magasanikbacteria bacterium CG10_big_fil_rev_8_21_14_0_10_43_6]